MSNNPHDKPAFPDHVSKAQFEGLKETLDDIREKVQQSVNSQPPEVQQQIEKSKGFIERNQRVIVGGIVAIVALKVNKRKVAKATAKAVTKELAKVQPLGAAGAPEYFDDIVAFLRATPEMNYIARGGKTLHVLLDHNKVLSFMGDFDQMKDSEVNAFLINFFTKNALNK